MIGDNVTELLAELVLAKNGLPNKKSSPRYLHPHVRSRHESRGSGNGRRSSLNFGNPNDQCPMTNRGGMTKSPNDSQDIGH